MATRQKSENRDCHKHGHSSEIGKQELSQTWPLVRDRKTGTVTNMSTRQRSENRDCHKRVHSSEIGKQGLPQTWPLVRNWKTETTTNMASRQKSENRDCHKHGHSSEIWKQALSQTCPLFRDSSLLGNFDIWQQICLVNKIWIKWTCHKAFRTSLIVAELLYYD